MRIRDLLAAGTNSDSNSGSTCRSVAAAFVLSDTDGKSSRPSLPCGRNEGGLRTWIPALLEKTSLKTLADHIGHEGKANQRRKKPNWTSTTCARHTVHLVDHVFIRWVIDSGPRKAAVPVPLPVSVTPVFLRTEWLNAKIGLQHR